MITNIEKYKKDFVKMPSKYIEEPKTSKDWINNLYYRFTSIFRAFDKKEILDIFTPECFFYDQNLNLYFYHDTNTSELFSSKDWKDDIEWCTEKKYCDPTIIYNITENKILLAVTDTAFKRKDSIVIIPNYDIEFIKENLNYNDFNDWTELRKKTDALIKKVTDILDNYKFYDTNTHWVYRKPEKYEHYSFNIPISYKVIGGLFVEINHKTFYAADNKLEWRTYEYSTKKYCEFTNTIQYTSLLEDENFIVGYDEDFVKECVAWYKRKDIQDKIDEKEKLIKDAIEKKKKEIEKLEKQLQDNQPEIENLNKKKKSTTGKTIKINLK